jgi:hypothetical protein
MTARRLASLAADVAAAYGVAADCVTTDRRAT